jgi:hypothetical protein
MRAHFDAIGPLKAPDTKGLAAPRTKTMSWPEAVKVGWTSAPSGDPPSVSCLTPLPSIAATNTPDCLLSASVPTTREKTMR